MRTITAMLFATVALIFADDQIFTFDGGLPPNAKEPFGYVSLVNDGMGKSLYVQDRNPAYLHFDEIEMSNDMTVAFWFKITDSIPRLSTFQRYMLLAKQIEIKTERTYYEGEYYHGISIKIVDDTKTFIPELLVPSEHAENYSNVWMPLVWTRHWKNFYQVDSVFFYDRLVFAERRKGFNIRTTPMSIGKTVNGSGYEFFFDHLCILDRALGSEDLDSLHSSYVYDVVNTVRPDPLRARKPKANVMRPVNPMGRCVDIKYTSTLMITKNYYTLWKEWRNAHNR